MENELERLKAENEELRKEQDIMFLLLDLTLYAVEIWGKKHGLFRGDSKESGTDIDNRNDQISVLLENIGKSGKNVLLNRFLTVINTLKEV